VPLLLALPVLLLVLLAIHMLLPPAMAGGPSALCNATGYACFTPAKPAPDALRHENSTPARAWRNHCPQAVFPGQRRTPVRVRAGPRLAPGTGSP